MAPLQPFPGLLNQVIKYMMGGNNRSGLGSGERRWEKWRGMGRGYWRGITTKSARERICFDVISIYPKQPKKESTANHVAVIIHF